MQAILRRKIVATLGTLPLGWFGKNTSGSVRKKTQNDIADLHYLVAHQAVETVGAVATPVFGVGYVVFLDWRLALVAVATLPVYIAAYAVMTRDMDVKMAEMNKGIEAISSTIVEFVAGISVVKAFGQAGKAHSRYRSAAIAFGDAYGGWVGPMLRIDALSSISLSAPVVLLVNLLGGVWFVSAGWVTPLDVIAAALIAMALPVSILAVSFGMQARREASAAAGRLVELFETLALPEPVQPVSPDSSEVGFDNVRFSYDGMTEVLRDVSFAMPTGSVTALVGASGSGKSTLATLVLRFHDVTDGSVTIGGVDVRNIATTELYRHVGFVLQDVQLLNESVLDNIRLGRPEADLDTVRVAARAAQIDERILALPRGYDSVIGEDAVLSGGEAQRVSIARAILADTPILVLDEATAFADPESEAEIQRALSTLARGRTILVIAHRLESIMDADRILVLDRGEIVEQGTHAELVAATAHYSRMWAALRRSDATDTREVAAR
jgi:ATP-binding cassette subfamily B protein